MNERRLIPLLFFFIAVLYCNSITGGFLMDDTFLVRDNPYIESFSNFISYFTSGEKEFGRPIRQTSFCLDTLLFGKNTIVYHIANILYYFIFCLLAYLFSERMFQNRVLSLITALLFAAHPLHTEGVAYISGRKDVLGGIFAFASLLQFLHYRDTDQKKHGLLTILFFLLAIGTKETYAMLPLLYPAVACYQGGSFRKHRSFYVSLLAGAFFFVVFVVFVRNRIFFNYIQPIPVYGHGLGVNLATAVKICANIIYLTFFPFAQSADYTFNALKRINASDPVFFFFLLLLLSLAGGAYFLRTREKEMSFSLVWLLVGLLPVAQIVPYPEIISERSLIFLSFGGCLFLAILFLKLQQFWTYGLAGALVLLFSFTTIERNRVWHNERSLWQATAGRFPDCARAQYNLGIALAQRGDLRGAEKAFLASLSVNPPDLVTVPDYSLEVLINLGNTYALLGDFCQARECYRKTLFYRKNDPLAQRNLWLVEQWAKAARKEGTARVKPPAFLGSEERVGNPGPARKKTN